MIADRPFFALSLGWLTFPLLQSFSDTLFSLLAVKAIG
jgi:hypothetical protein